MMEDVWVFVFGTIAGIGVGVLGTSLYLSAGIVEAQRRADIAYSSGLIDGARISSEKRQEPAPKRCTIEDLFQLAPKGKL